MYRLILTLSFMTYSLWGTDRIDLNYLKELYPVDEKEIHSVCNKCFEMCQVAYLDRSNYRCHYDHSFSFPTGYRLPFFIENAIDGKVLCRFVYNCHTRQLGEVKWEGN